MPFNFNSKIKHAQKTCHTNLIEHFFFPKHGQTTSRIVTQQVVKFILGKNDMFVPQQMPLNYYRVHNAYHLKSACSGNQNSKASILWKMSSRHKIIPTNIKGVL